MPTERNAKIKKRRLEALLKSFPDFQKKKTSTFSVIQCTGGVFPVKENDVKTVLKTYLGVYLRLLCPAACRANDGTVYSTVK